MSPTPSESQLRARRRRAVGSLLRSLVTTVLLVAVYYRAPLDRPVDGWLLLWFLLVLVALALAVAWQTRAIVVSDVPRLRAIETAMIGLPFLILLYAALYTVLAQNDPGNFNVLLDRTGALYFTMTVFTTVGFGDIVPVTHVARIVTMTQMITGLLAVGVVAKLLLGAVQQAVSSREHDQ